MLRASHAIVLALVLGLGARALAQAEDHDAHDAHDVHEGHGAHDGREDAPGRTGEPPAPRLQVTAQLASEAATIERTRAIVAGKLTDAGRVRVQRLRAAYRLLRAPLHPDARPRDRMAAARRRAAARLLVDRDAAERSLLADEAARLTTAAERVVVANGKIPTLSSPPALVAPARGAIIRRFGTIEHAPSRTTLARRGIDLEVELRAPVTAPAAGTVRYAGPIRGLDEGVILDHGDYFSVIAKLGELAVPVGAPVQAGDRLGRAVRHRVYVELRVRIGPGGIPIDPEPLLTLVAAGSL